ncbi:hypothetical protein [Lewinella sp. LCG006]|uniref:hypothetical protein n=1 Tax=Lewinella sp. LCG006 TaxID=3231911 RepID=UPI00345FEDDC
MSDQKNQNWKLGFGLLAGALAGYWLNSNQGRRVRKEMQTSAIEYTNQATEYIKTQADSLSSTASEYFDQSKEAVQQAAQTVKNKFTSNVDDLADQAEEAVEQTETKLKRGISAARKNVKNSAEAIA